jgi:hypothetical protein
VTDARLDVSGIPEAVAALDAVKAAALDMTGPHDAAGRALAAAIAAATPRRSGLLASSWTVAAGPDRVSVENVQLYAAPVEYGVPARAMMGAHMAERTLTEQTPAIGAGYESALADAGKSAGFEVKR